MKDTARYRAVIRGNVVGVNFRSFACTLARRLGVSGNVRNVGNEVMLEAEGDENVVQRFFEVLRTEAPRPISVADIELRPVRSMGDKDFIQQ